ncbi:MAG: hypothetical protein GY755_17885, partial [Chloroflexi bacterium]|nr:hypothetical protein [Chloroflexota bacterium]
VRQGNYEDLADCKLVVIAAGVSQKKGESRLDLLKHRLSQLVKATQWSPIFCVAKPISTDLFFHPWST